MSVPALLVYASGPIAVSADNLNTFTQTAQTAAQVRTLTGVSGMCILLQGISIPGDGLGGLFYWSSTATATDDNLDVLVPNGTVPGAWLRLTLLATEIASSVTNVANIAALRALTGGSVAATIFVAGYYLGGDGGGGTFWYNAADTSSADNGGTIIVDGSARRWYRETSGESLNIKWFGGSPTIADNSAALLASLAALPSTGGQLAFPPGKFTFTGHVSYTMVAALFSLSLVGAGADATELYWPNTAGITLNFLGAFNSAHIRDLSFLTGSQNAGTAIMLNQTSISISDPANTAQSDITNVTIRGADGYGQTDWWSYGIYNYGVSNVVFRNVNIAGTTAAEYATQGNGVTILGTSTLPPVVFGFDTCVFNFLGSGFSYGSYTQGVTITDTNFTGCGIGIDVPSGAVGIQQLTVKGCQFNCDNGILLSAGCGSTMISNNLLFVPQGGNGISAASIDRMTITGNDFEPTSTSNTSGYGIAITAYTVAAAAITGNCFYHIPSTAIALAAGSSGVNVQSNVYNACGTNVSNAGTGNTVGGGSS